MTLSRRDGYWLCKELGSAECTCEVQGRNPCNSIRLMLVGSEGNPERALVAEKARVERAVEVAR